MEPFLAELWASLIEQAIEELEQLGFHPFSALCKYGLVRRNVVRRSYPFVVSQPHTFTVPQVLWIAFPDAQY
jgi:hypothetical protein